MRFNREPRYSPKSLGEILVDRRYRVLKRRNEFIIEYNDGGDWQRWTARTFTALSHAVTTIEEWQKLYKMVAEESRVVWESE